LDPLRSFTTGSSRARQSFIGTTHALSYVYDGLNSDGLCDKDFDPYLNQE